MVYILQWKLEKQLHSLYSKKSRPNSTFNAKNYPKPCQNGEGEKISPSHYKIVASRYSVAPHWTLFNYSKSGNYDDMMNSKLWNIHKKRKTKARKLTQQKWYVNLWWCLNAKMLHFLDVSIIQSCISVYFLVNSSK